MIRAYTSVSVLIWRMVQQHPGVHTSQVVATLEHMASEERLKQALYTLRAAGALERKPLTGRHGSAWYALGEQPKGPENLIALPPLVSLAEIDAQREKYRQSRDAATGSRQALHAPRPERPARAEPADALSGPVVPPRQVDLSQHWPEPYLPLVCARPGAMDYRNHPSRRGSHLVWCYAQLGDAS